MLGNHKQFDLPYDKNVCKMINEQAQLKYFGKLFDIFNLMKQQFILVNKMLKSQNQTSEDQQISNQQEEQLNQEEICTDYGSSETQNSQQEKQNGCSHDQSNPVQPNLQNKNKFNRRCPYYILIFLLLAYLAGEYIMQIQMKYRKQQQYVSNMKALKQIQSANSINTLIPVIADNIPNQRQGFQPQNIQIKHQQNNNQQQTLIPNKVNDQQNQMDQKPQDFVKPNMYYSQGMEFNKPLKAQNDVKVPTFQEMYDQFLKKSQKSNEYPESNHQNLPNQLPINPVIYPFNKTALDKLQYNQYTTYVGISKQAVSQAKRLRQLTNYNINVQNTLSIQEKKYYQQRYMISKYDQLPFCIVVPTFNNAHNERYLRNIQSIVMQNYKNFHIVIIDDASQDNTGQFIKQYLESQHKIASDKYIVIRNDVQLNAMPNLRNAAKNHCKPQEIFLIVDGDDELIGRQVLKLFNAVFQQKKLWFVYSNFLISGKKIGYSRPFPKNTIKKNSFRSYPFISSHLRAFYTKLFLNIKQQDIQDGDGNYFKAANDVAICFPILEQSQQRVGYIPQITYHYNSNTGLNNHNLRLKEQRSNERTIRKKPNYRRLQNLMD